MNTSLTAKPETPDTPHDLLGRPRGVRRQKRSWASEIITALYVALLVSTPWLVKDARWFTPPTNSVEVQLFNKAAAPSDAPAPAVAKILR